MPDSAPPLPKGEHAVEEEAELEDRQIWVWGRMSVNAGLGLHCWQQTSHMPAYRHCEKKNDIVTFW